MRWRWLDRIEDCEPGISALATKTFSGDEDFFQDHFPGMPIVPGVLQIEMMAQAAGKCVALAHPDRLPVLGSVKESKFYHNIKPGDLCLIRVKILKIAKSYSMAEGVIEVNSQKMSSATLLFGQVDRSQLLKSKSADDFDQVSRDWQERQMRAEKT